MVTSIKYFLFLHIYDIIVIAWILGGINSLDSTGQVKVDGEIWSATSQNATTIPKGTEVEILEIKGVKVIVAPIK